MSIVSSPKLPSERRFGLMLAAAFAIIGTRGIFKHWGWAAYDTCLAASIVLGFLALVAPRSLALLNQAWFQLGHWMGKIVSPIVLAIIFFGILTPVSIVTRLFGRDELRLKPRALDSWWIDRAPPRPAADSFKNQF